MAIVHIPAHKLDMVGPPEDLLPTLGTYRFEQPMFKREECSVGHIFGTWILTAAKVVGRVKLPIHKMPYDVEWYALLQFVHGWGCVWTWPAPPGLKAVIKIKLDTSRRRLQDHFLSADLTTPNYKGAEWERYIRAYPLMSYRPPDYSPEYWTEFRERLTAYDNMQALGSQV